MREKRHRTEQNPEQKIEKKIEEVLIARNRAIVPFVLSFSYEAENIALSPLGNLSGVFSVSDRESDSAYIGNCLAAVAKKEYFANPKKTPGDAFESALHKTNLALARLVQEGHVSWIGKLHGAIIAIQKNEIHFSVSGNGVVLLCRNEFCSLVSEGMTSEEAMENPLKTFTDISSGTILPGDKIILSTPELVELLSPSEIGKQSKKLDRERFTQFIKTALVNTYPQASTVIIDITEASAEPEKTALRYAEETSIHEETESKASYIENIFSGKTFQKNRSRRTQKLAPTPQKQIASAAEVRKVEHIDARTGHIYLRAEEDTEQEHDRSNVFSELLSETHRQSVLFFSNLGKKSVGLFRSIGAKAALFGKKVWLCIKQTSHIGIEKTQRFIAERKSTRIQNLRFHKNAFDHNENPVSPEPDESKPSQQHWMNKELLLHFFGIVRFRIQEWGKAGGTAVQTLLTRIPKKHLFVFLAVILGITLLSFGLFLSRKESVEEISVTEAPQEEQNISPSSSSVLPENELLAQHISETEVFSIADSEEPLLPMLLDNQLFALTKGSVVNAENKLSLSLPESAMPAIRATAMNDLNAIFVYGSDKKMYLYYPNAKSFVENTLPLPDNFSPDDMGTYLTYLYTLDRKEERILRFPRAEGGFGMPNEWLKDKVSLSGSATMSIGENILIGSESTVFSFSKGRGGPLSLSETKTPITIQDIALSDDGSFFVLDAQNKRVVRFGKDGQLLGQYLNEHLGEARSIVVSSNGTALYAATENKIFLFEVK